MSLLSELALTARTYAGGGYPPFIYFGRGSNSHLPVFCYHEIMSEEFELHLRYLAENHYRTLNCDQLVGRLLAAPHPPVSSDACEVALTFDDGLVGVYEVVYPLLRKYRMKAVAYIAPAWIGRPGFLSWDQCCEMQASGSVDIQSHSYAHANLVTSLKLVRVWRRSERSPIPWGIPGFDSTFENVRISSLPVLEGASLFSGQPSVRIPDAFWHECTRFESESLKGDLERHYKALVEKYAHSAVRIDESKLLEWMTNDLRRSREEIERAIPGHSVRHFAFPWHANSGLAWKAAEAAGFVSAAIGLEGTDQSQGCHGGVTRILRVNADFLCCLHGESRSGFLRVLAAKTWRRARGRNVYGIAN